MKQFSECFLAKYPKNGKIMQFFKEATQLECTWENLSIKSNLYDFAEYLCTNVAQSSARQYCAKIKAVINVYTDQVSMPSGWEKVLTIKNDESESIYLTEKEIQKLISYDPCTPTEAYVRDVFVVAALTGARHSDAVTFTETNIHDDVLQYVSVKTHIKATVPLAPAARRIIMEDIEFRENSNRKKGALNPNRKKGGFDFEASENGLSLPSKKGTLYEGATDYRGKVDSVSDRYFNDVIRHICEYVGIDDKVRLYRRGGYQEGKKYEFVTSHTARKSFASNLYLRGCDIYSISKMLGHSSVEMTASKYIVCGLRDLDSKVMGFFNNFQ